MVFVPYTVRHGIFGEPSLNGHFSLHISDVVLFESQPLIRGVSWKVTGALTVGFCRRTGLTEIFDEFLALGQLLLFKPKHGTDTLKGKRQTHRGSPNHGAAPGFRVKVIPCGIPQMSGQTDAFKVGIEGPFDNGIVRQCRNDLGGNLLTAGKVDQLNGIAVYAVGKEQNFKYGRLHIAIHPGLGEILIAVGLYIN